MRGDARAAGRIEIAGARSPHKQGADQRRVGFIGSRPALSPEGVDDSPGTRSDHDPALPAEERPRGGAAERRGSRRADPPSRARAARHAVLPGADRADPGFEPEPGAEPDRRARAATGGCPGAEILRNEFSRRPLRPQRTAAATAAAGRTVEPRPAGRAIAIRPGVAAGI